MASPTGSAFWIRTAFTVPVDHVSSRTGITAGERATTIAAILDPASSPADFVRPGTEDGVILGPADEPHESGESKERDAEHPHGPGHLVRGDQADPRGEGIGQEEEERPRDKEEGRPHGQDQPDEACGCTDAGDVAEFGLRHATTVTPREVISREAVGASPARSSWGAMVRV